MTNFSGVFALKFELKFELIGCKFKGILFPIDDGLFWTKCGGKLVINNGECF